MASLFDPIQIGKFEVGIRIAFAASGFGYAPHDESVCDQYLCIMWRGQEGETDGSPSDTDWYMINTR